MRVEPEETLHFCTNNTPDVVARQMVKDQERVAELEMWKESALDVLNAINLQAVGNELGVPLGAPVGPSILPGIRSLKAKIR